LFEFYFVVPVPVLRARFSFCFCCLCARVCTSTFSLHARALSRKLLDLHALGADCEDPQFCDEVEEYLGEQVCICLVLTRVLHNVFYGVLHHVGHGVLMLCALCVE
jgi:hypothetical protein